MSPRARANAADLRVLAARITALPDLAPEARPAQAALHTALAAADPAELVAPSPGSALTWAPATVTSPPTSTPSPSTPADSAMKATDGAPDTTAEQRWRPIGDQRTRIRTRTLAETGAAIAAIDTRLTRIGTLRRNLYRSP
ncbi:hypothetical protein [Streptomyces sp. CB03911]|uniref:hypothetical protein n=1 Tax=Streptomyces sp. CB03911 TaxID=1804758 RepID=UPI00093B57D6|nr:hypothetical protein A6A07_23540 [Streptomyces sp. CB03911]